MTALNQREKRLAIAVGSLVGLLILYFAIISPLQDGWNEVERQEADVTRQQRDAQLVFDQRDHLSKQWKSLQATGLQADASRAESQAENAIARVAEQAGVSQVSLKTDAPSTEGSFLVTGLSIQGKGSMKQIAQMVYLLETTKTPLRIVAVQITPQQKEGVDQLSVEVNLSTICQAPTAKTSGSAGNNNDNTGESVETGGSL